MIEGLLAGLGMFVFLVVAFVVLGKLKYAMLAITLIVVCIGSWIAWFAGLEVNYLLLLVGLPAAFAPHLAIIILGPGVFLKP